jgi:FtsH-binding integral membrane protein
MKGDKVMNKWGVRLIGIYFIVWAIHDFFGLLTGQFSKEGFMGIIINAFGHDIATWIGAFLCLYIGIQLIRFDQRGRRWALILLWPWVIISGFLLVWIILSPDYSIFSHADTSITLRAFYTDWPGEIRGPYRVYSVYVSIFFFYTEHGHKLRF